jgi:hypothetical protein
MTTEDATAGLVRDNPEQQRFEMVTSAGLAVAEYRRDGDTLIIFHTEVPPALRGQGMGDKLVRGVLEEVRRRNLKVVPRCWFVREFVASHPEYRDLIA